MTTCPVCRAPFSPIPDSPEAGTLALCGGCRCWLVWDTSDQVRALTNKEWGALPEEKRMELTAIREQVPTR